MGTDLQTERELRAARNQAMFRDVNERLEGLAETFRFIAEKATFACECADTTCLAQFQMTLDQYEAVRANPTHFVVLPGHVYDDVEDVVAATDGYVVVSKRNVAARYALEADPRSSHAE